MRLQRFLGCASAMRGMTVRVEPRWIGMAATVGLVMAAPGSGVAAGGPVTELVSVSSSGAPSANDDSFNSAVSADGRFVTFTSWAKLSSTIPHGMVVYARDRQTGVTEPASVVGPSSSGRLAAETYPGSGISADGRFVVFNVHGHGAHGASVQVRDRQAQRTRRISLTPSGGWLKGGSSVSNGRVAQPISADGRYVVFDSWAYDLVRGDSNGHVDVFVRDRARRMTRRVSVSNSGHQGNNASWFSTISADGRYVAFQSSVSNLVAGDTNGRPDIFVYDRATARLRRVSVSSAEAQANAASRYPTISAHGRYVAFASAASNLVPGDTNRAGDIFVRDRTTGTTRRVSLATGGAQANAASGAAAISANGQRVAFISGATSLVAGDTNDAPDVFLRDLQTGTTIRVDLSTAGAQANKGAKVARLADRGGSPSISADGRNAAFTSRSTNLVAKDPNPNYDIYIRGPLP